MKEEERQYHLRVAEEIKARAEVIFEQVRRGEKSRAMLKTARAIMADSERVKKIAEWAE